MILAQRRDKSLPVLAGGDEGNNRSWCPPRTHVPGAVPASRQRLTAIGHKSSHVKQLRPVIAVNQDHLSFPCLRQWKWLGPLGQTLMGLLASGSANCLFFLANRQGGRPEHLPPFF